MKLLSSALALALILLGGCGRSGSAANGEVPVDNTTLARLNLTSSAFRGGGSIPVQYTCEGANQSPPLAWGDPPAGTKSFALIIDDPDAPSGTFRHWGVYDIHASARSIGSGQHVGHEVTNDFGKPGYGGPCPPKGHEPHHYHFKLFALSVDKLDLPGVAKIADLERAATAHAVATGELVATYERR